MILNILSVNGETILNQLFFSYTGRFDMDKHKKWIDDNPNKRPKPLETRKHVSHFYSGGDICDITGNCWAKKICNRNLTFWRLFK